MTTLYNRDFAIKIGQAPPLEVHPPAVPIKDDDKAQSTLRVTFEIEKTSTSEPNKCEVQISNLSQANRELLKKYAGLPKQFFPISIEAGYRGDRELIFKGDIALADSYRESVTWQTKISAQDGGYKYTSARYRRSFARGTPVYALVLSVITAFGIGKGNAIRALAFSPRGLTTLKKGAVVQGKISDILDKWISSLGYQWSIQDGVLQVREADKANMEPVVVLNQYSGLLGSPERGEKGSIGFFALLQGKIRPGRRVVLESDTATGNFVIERAVYTGDTWGNEWQVHAEAVPERLI